MPEISLLTINGLAATLVVFFGFTCLGSVVGRWRWSAADPVVGWALGSSVLTAAGVLHSSVLGLTALVVGLIAIVIAIRAWQRGAAINSRLLWLTVLLLLPYFVQVATAPTAHWDDFSHWLPNAAYLFRFDDFPRKELPTSISFWPAYPYALPLWHWLTSRLSGAFFAPAGALANLLLLGTFAAALVQLVRVELAQLNGRSRRLASLGWAAFGIVLVTAANPSFVKSYYVTAYADCATAVSVVMAALLGWQMLEQLREGEADCPAARALAWQFGTIAALLVNLKQANLVLILLVLAGMGVVAVRERAIKSGQLVRLLPRMVLPMVAVYLLWRYHVQAHMPDREFAFLPMEQWRWNMLRDILSGVWSVAAKKGGHYGLMVALSCWAVAAWIRGPGRLERFLVIVATVFIGYSGFLIFTYSPF